MKFETVRIHFLSYVLACCHPEILLPWQREAATLSINDKFVGLPSFIHAQTGPYSVYSRYFLTDSCH